jgi:3-hydroxybutyryl-CoA dehydrogenase
MGSGIGQVAATAGHTVILQDVDDVRLEHALGEIEHSLARFIQASRLTGEEAKASLSRLSTTTRLGDAVGEADVVIEAVPEVLSIKQDVLGEAASAAPDHALLGSNTSQLSITMLGTVLGDAGRRLVGMHFFNPPVMMKLVELIRGVNTSDDSLEQARRFAEGLGKQVVVCRKDSPGFITSRAYAALRLECLRILEEGVATIEDIDTALRIGFNFPMGPFELSDLNGVDTYYHVLQSLAEAYGERFMPTPGLRNLVAAGRFGKKTGAGFYDYDEHGNRTGSTAEL